MDALLAYWADPPAWPVSLAQLDDAALESLRGKLRMQAWILSLTLPADADTAARLPAIRDMLAQAGVLGNGSASDDNNLLAACQAMLDPGEFLSGAGTVVSGSTVPAGGSVASSVGESGSLAVLSREERQAVPA